MHPRIIVCSPFIQFYDSTLNRSQQKIWKWWKKCWAIVCNKNYFEISSDFFKIRHLLARLQQNKQRKRPRLSDILFFQVTSAAKHRRRPDWSIFHRARFRARGKVENENHMAIVSYLFAALSYYSWIDISSHNLNIFVMDLFREGSLFMGCCVVL